MPVIAIFIFLHHMLFFMCFHDEGVCMMCKMTVQNTVNLEFSSAHYLFYLSVSPLHFPLERLLEAVGQKIVYWLHHCIGRNVQTV